MHKIQIDVSPAQMRRLHKGHKVRVKKGEGFELLVHPNTYNIVTRAFNKNKGSEIQLSPEEIDMNRSISKAISPEAHNPPLQPRGSGIMEDIGDYATKYNPYAHMYGRGVGEDVVNDIVRNMQKNGLLNHVSMPSMGGSLRDIASHVNLANKLNEHLGTNYGYLARAGLDNAINGVKSSALSKMGIDARYADAPFAQIPLGIPGPHSRMIGGTVERGSIGRNGSMLSAYTPPALVSQPFSANFQFQHFLPPQYQHFNTGGSHDAMGNGLYV